MGAWRQLKLLLWKDFLVRKRYPGIIGLTLGWAIAVFMVLYVVRESINPEYVPTCQYKARTLPSAGLFPFLQSFVCNVDNKCENVSEYEEVPQYKNAKLTNVLHTLQDAFSDEDVLNIFKNIPNMLALVKAVGDGIDTSNYEGLFGRGVPVFELVKKPPEIKRLMRRATPDLDENILDDIFNASFKFGPIFQSIGSTNLSSEICNSTQLKKYLILKNANAIEDVSLNLCNINTTVIPSLLENILSHADFDKFLKKLEEIIDHFTSYNVYEDVGKIVEVLSNLDSVDKYLPSLKLPKWLPKIIPLINTMNKKPIDKESIIKALDIIEPYFNETTDWFIIKEIILINVDTVIFIQNHIIDTHLEPNVLTSRRNFTHFLMHDFYENLFSITRPHPNIQKMYNFGKSTSLFVQYFLNQTFYIMHNFDWNSYETWAKITNMVDLTTSLHHPFLIQSYYMLFYLYNGDIRSLHYILKNRLGSEEIIYDICKKHNDTISDVFELGPEFLESLLTCFSNITCTNIIMRNKSNISDFFCYEEKFKQISTFNYSLGNFTKLCDTDFESFITDVTEEFHLDFAAQMFNATENVNFFMPFWHIEHSDFSSALNNTRKLVDFINTKLASNSTNFEWEKLFPNISNSEWENILTTAKKNKVLYLINTQLAYLRVFIENDDHIIFSLHSTSNLMKAIINEYKLMPNLLLKETIENFPVIIESMLKIFTNKSQILELTRTNNWEKYLCESNDKKINTINKLGCEMISYINLRQKIHPSTLTPLREFLRGSHKKITPEDLNEFEETAQEFFLIIEEIFSYKYPKYNWTEMQTLQPKYWIDWFKTLDFETELNFGLRILAKVIDIIDTNYWRIHKDVQAVKIATSNINQYIIFVNDIIDFAISSNTSERKDIQIYYPITYNLSKIIIPNLRYFIKDFNDYIAKDNSNMTYLIHLFNTSCATHPLELYGNFSTETKIVTAALRDLVCNSTKYRKEWKFDYELKRNVVDYDSVADWQETVSEFGKLTRNLRKFRNSTPNNANLGNWSNINQQLELTYQGFEFERLLFRIIDTEINSPSSEYNSLLFLWTNYKKCGLKNMSENCTNIRSDVAKYTAKFISSAVSEVATRMRHYLRSINGTNGVDPLTLLGFSNSSGVYMMYSKLPDIISVFVNSYRKPDFERQILEKKTRNRSLRCADVLGMLSIPENNSVTLDDIKIMKRYLCPSVLDWPVVEDNYFLATITKLESMTTRTPTVKFDKTYMSTLNDVLALKDDILNVAKYGRINITVLWNKPWLNNMRTTFSNLQKLEFSPNTTLTRLFKYIDEPQNKKSIYQTALLSKAHGFGDFTYVVKLITRSLEKFSSKNWSSSDSTTREQAKMLVDLFEFYPNEVAGILAYAYFRSDGNIHFLYEVQMWLCDEQSFASEFKLSVPQWMLTDEDKIMSRLCEVNATYFDENLFSDRDFSNITSYDFPLEKAVIDFISLVVNASENQKNIDLNTVIIKDLISKNILDGLFPTVEESRNYSMVKAEELTKKPTYRVVASNSFIKFLTVCLKMLESGDWWGTLKAFDEVPSLQSLMMLLETIPFVALHIAEGAISPNLPYRLATDIVHNRYFPCRSTMDLGDYVDEENILFILQETCRLRNKENEIVIVEELLTEDNETIYIHRANETILAENIFLYERELVNLMKTGVKKPLLPNWLNGTYIVNKYKAFGTKMKQPLILLQTVTGAMTDVIDVGSLFYKTQTNCTWCSWATVLVREFSQQLSLTPRYIDLLCHMPNMTFTDVKRTLTDDFRWGRFYKKITRNFSYSVDDFNEEIHGVVDIFRNQIITFYTNKTLQSLPGECLRNLTKSAAAKNITTYVTIISEVIKFVKTASIHLLNKSTLERITKEIYDVQTTIPLKVLIQDNSSLISSFKEIGFNKGQITTFLNSDVYIKELLKIKNPNDMEKYLSDPVMFHSLFYFHNILNRLDNFDHTKDFTDVAHFLYLDIMDSDINVKVHNWRKRQIEHLDWFSKIFDSLEKFLLKSEDLLAFVTTIDFSSITNGTFNPSNLLEGVADLLRNKSVEKLFDSFRDLIKQLSVVIHDKEIEQDLYTFVAGVESLNIFKNLRLLTLKYNISDLTDGWQNVSLFLIQEIKLNPNVTNEILNSSLNMLEIFSSQKGLTNIKEYLCNYNELQKLFFFNNDNSVETAMNVSESLCHLGRKELQQLTVILMKNINFSNLLNEVVDSTTKNILNNANLSEEDGKNIMKNIGPGINYLPTLKSMASNVTNDLKALPHFEELKTHDFTRSVIISPNIISSATTLLCGRTLVQDHGKIYRTIAEAKDFSTSNYNEMEEMSLPTQFCRNIYRNIVDMDAGKVIWSYMKPLIRGKIIFTPNTPATREIMQLTNFTFTRIAEFQEILLKTITNIEEIDDMEHTIKTIQDFMSSFIVQTAVQQVLDDGNITLNNSTNFNLTNMFQDFGGIKKLKTSLSFTKDILKCILLNRFVGVDTEMELEHEAKRLMQRNEFIAGVVFLNINNRSKRSLGIPHNITYKIRMDIDSVPTTNYLRYQFWTPGPDSDFLDDLRYFRGFIQLQDMLDNAIIKLKSNSDLPNWNTLTQQMPYPCWTKDFFKSAISISQGLQVCFFFGLIVMVAASVRYVVWEKESGNTMVMNVMGLKYLTHCTSWFIVSIVEMLIVMLCAFIILFAGRILPSTSPTLLFVYMLDYGFSVVMFCYMVSSMFDSASLAAVGSAIFYLLSFMPYIIIISLETTLSVWLEMLVNLSMSTSFCYGCLYIIRYEVQGIGLSWNNAWSTPFPGDNMNFGMTCVFLAFDGILYGVIGYLCSKRSQELKKFFHYLPKRFFPNRYRLIREAPSYVTFDNELYGTNYSGENYLNATVSSTSVINDEPLKIGVTIKGLTKIYNTRKKTVKAIENIDITLYTGQVTTLLGHNGAGKTTLIKILTGMMKPTSGQIIINSEITRSTSKACRYLGVCSQTSVLIDTMSAREHLIFYAKLKTSGDFVEITAHVLNMIDSLSLGALADEPVSHLSEGMRRRLCVAIAFIGQPKLVVLDEPSSGVDPVARRQIWDLVVRHKEGCTVLLTTHYLDEAELLSDRVVVLHKGKVLCSGSPLTLKHTYGNGYKLLVTYPSLRHNYEVDETTIQSLLSTIKKLTPNANLVNVQGCTVSITVPFMAETGTPNNYEQLALELEDNQAKLGFLNFSMNCTTLEQVFLELCANADATVTGKLKNNFETQIRKSYSSVFSNSVDELNNFKDDMELLKTGGSLTGSNISKFFALTKKRAIHYLLDWRIVLCALLLPTIFTAIAMGFSLIRPPNTNEPSLKLSPDLYQPHTTSFISIDTKNLDSYVNEVSQKLLTLSWRNQELEEYTKKSRNCQCKNGMQKCQVTDKVSDVMLKLSSANDTVDWLIDSHNEYIQRRYGGWSLSEQPDNSSAMIVWYNNKGYHAMPAYLNTMNNAILQTVSPGSTITTYSHPLKLSVEQLSKSTVAQHIADVGIAMVLLVAFSLVPASGSIYLVQERITEEKRLQFLCGVSPTLYWIVAFIWDMIVLIGALLLAIVVFNIFGLPVYVARDNLAAVSLLILLYGWACIPFIHLTQRFFNDASMANMILFCCCAFIGIIELTCLLLMDILGTTTFVEDLRYVLHKIYLIFPQFVLGDGLVEISKNNIQSDILKRFHMDTYISPLSWDLLGLHYLCLAVVGIILFVINLAIENQWFKKIKQRSVNYPSDTCCLETVNLCKEYNTVSGKIAAVDNLSLKVPFGQCLGLIGVNGAGKSTTFKMLTTEIQATRGIIFLHGRDIGSKPLCTGEMGYCPQCDSLDPKLTVLQTMKFYLTLRGINNQYEIARKLMLKFELITYANRRNENLSGGNKRKLCTALSILGNTSMILMDEPTSGMDPYSRHLVGSTIQQITRQNRSVILTSHSVEDCENLCSHVIVMINGKMVCQGSPQDLKERFGSGYIISVRLTKPTDQDILLELIQTHFPGAELMSRQYCSSQFTVPTEHILVSQMFNRMSKISECVSVEDYNLVQSSLDQVFINLANKSDEIEKQNQKSTFPDMYTMTVL